VYINDLLASGRIPDLYDQEGKDEIINMVTSRVKEDGLVPDAPGRRREKERRGAKRGEEALRVLLCGVRCTACSPVCTV